MRLSFGQQMQLGQKQVLAPRMIQAMEILQLPTMALQERIEQESLENPCLEVGERANEVQDNPTQEQESPDAPAETEREFVVEDGESNEADFERLLNSVENMPVDYQEGSRPSRGQMELESERRHDAMANMVARPPTLQDYLHNQLSWFELSPEVRRMADRIIYNLDSNGYLKTPLAELIGPAPIDDNKKAEGWLEQQTLLAEKALRVVQRLDPPGIGARSLQECMLLQLKEEMPNYQALRTLVENHLNDLEQNRLPLIAKSLDCSIEQVQEYWEELRQLKPKPGAEFSETSSPNVTPDVFVERDDDGKYKVRLEDTQLPPLFISAKYRAMLENKSTDKKTLDFIRKKIMSAQWLIESIEQRRDTIKRVAQAIVDHQRRFLDDGPEYIEPLKMQQIADKVNVHVTTVSRAVDDKWLQSPRGIFPLRKFFVGGTTGADGEEVAWDKVRLQLQEIIDKEDKTKPYSDEALVEQLAKKGITVARRTVTKYRKAMGIPSSRQRRDWTKK